MVRSQSKSPAGVIVSIDPGRDRLRAEGRAAPAGARAHGDHPRRRNHYGERARPSAAKIARLRSYAHAGREHGRGRHERLREAPSRSRVGYRAAPAGTDLELQAGYSHWSRSSRAAASRSRFRFRRRSWCAGSTSRSLGQTAEIRKVRSPEPWRARVASAKARPGERLASVLSPSTYEARLRHIAGGGRSAQRGVGPARIFRSNRGIFAQLIMTTTPARRSRPPRTGPSALVQGLTRAQATEVGKQPRRGGEEGRHRVGRLRPRRLPVHGRVKVHSPKGAREGGLSF